MPGTSETIVRSSPRSALSSDDLPTLGCPISASASSVCGSAASLSGGSRSTIASSRSPVPSPWIAETGNGSPNPSRENSPWTEAKRFGRFGFVGDQQHGMVRAPQDPGDVDVDRIESVDRVDDEHDHVGIAGGDLGLLARAVRDRVVGVDVEVDPAGVDAGERPAAPLGQRVEPVARDAGRVLDDGQPLTDQTVEERALAHVGATDDRDGCGTERLSFDKLRSDLGAVEWEFGHGQLVVSRAFGESCRFGVRRGRSARRGADRSSFRHDLTKRRRRVDGRDVCRALAGRGRRAGGRRASPDPHPDRLDAGRSRGRGRAGADADDLRRLGSRRQDGRGPRNDRDSLRRQARRGDDRRRAGRDRQGRNDCGERGNARRHDRRAAGQADANRNGVPADANRRRAGYRRGDPARS